VNSYTCVSKTTCSALWQPLWAGRWCQTCRYKASCQSTTHPWAVLAVGGSLFEIRRRCTRPCRKACCPVLDKPSKISNYPSSWSEHPRVLRKQGKRSVVLRLQFKWWKLAVFELDGRGEWRDSELGHWLFFKTKATLRPYLSSSLLSNVIVKPYVPFQTFLWNFMARIHVNLTSTFCEILCF